CRALVERAVKIMQECQKDAQRSSETDCSREGHVYIQAEAALSRFAGPDQSKVGQAAITTKNTTTSKEPKAPVSPLDQVKAWWATCIGKAVPGHEDCEKDGDCLRECESEAYRRLDNVQFAELDLDGCQKVQ